MFAAQIGRQPILKEFGLPVASLGYVFSLFGLVGIFTPYISHYVQKRTKRVQNAIAYVTLVEMLLGLSLIFLYPPMFIILSTIFILRGTIGDIVSPMAATFLNKFIPSDARASILSFQSMVIALVMAIAVPIAGLVMDNIGAKWTFIWFSLFAIPSIIFYLKARED
jgi:predicted MFS family arabinose efflux permease